MAFGNGTDEGETTRRVRRAVAVETHATRWQFWGGLLGGLFVSGAITMIFLFATFADADDLKTTAADFHKHVESEAAKVGALEAQGKNIESDYHSVREQLWKIADRVGAARVAAPAHKETP